MNHNYITDNAHHHHIHHNYDNIVSFMMMISGEPVQSQGVEGEGAGVAEAHRGFEGFSQKAKKKSPKSSPRI